MPPDGGVYTALVRADCVSGRSRERQFTSPAAFLSSSHDHRADYGNTLGKTTPRVFAHIVALSRNMRKDVIDAA